MIACRICSGCILVLIMIRMTYAASDDEPPGLHALEFAAHLTSSPQSEPPGAARAVAPSPRMVSSIRPCRTIFGYLPYWEDADYLRYDLLTHIACFAMTADFHGNLSQPPGQNHEHDWPNGSPWSSVHAEAHANGVKVILVITNFSPQSIYDLLTNPNACQRLYTNIRNELVAGNADGVNIDFEGGNDPPWRGHINRFMCDLKDYLDAEVPGSEVSFAGPAVNWGGWDFPGLAACCDHIFIMGYNYHTRTSPVSAPCSPLIGSVHNPKNLTDTVDNQYGAVTASEPEKLVLGIPYYGWRWTTADDQPYAATAGTGVSTRFYEDEPKSQTHGVQWDSLSQTPWYRHQVGGTWEQVWFDNAQSVGLKYDLAISRNLGGVGIWALNYDRDRPELWHELDVRFGSACSPRVPPDFDEDGDVDQEDWGAFQSCMSGAWIPQSAPQCEKALLDGDSDVDGDDVTIFARCMSGAGIPADADCTRTP